MKKSQQFGRLLFFVIIYLLSFCYAIFFVNQTGWLLFFFLTLIAGIDLLSFLWPLHQLEFHSLNNLELHVRQPAELSFLIKKKGWICWFIHPVISKEKIMNTLPFFYFGQKKSIIIEFTPQKRGIIQSEEIEVSATDLFGWFERRRNFKVSVNWRVLPAFQLLEKNHLVQRMLKDSGEFTYDIKNYRTYQPGDPLKQIDWKVSAKKRELLLKQYDRQTTLAIRLVFYGQASPYFEEMLSLFYSLYKQLGDQVDYQLIGANLNRQGDWAEKFALIQPLQEEISLPDWPNQQVFLFVPEIDQSLEQKKRQQLTFVDYKSLKEWEENNEAAFEK